LRGAALELERVAFGAEVPDVLKQRGALLDLATLVRIGRIGRAEPGLPGAQPGGELAHFQHGQGRGGRGGDLALPHGQAHGSVKARRQRKAAMSLMAMIFAWLVGGDENEKARLGCRNFLFVGWGLTVGWLAGASASGSALRFAKLGLHADDAKFSHRRRLHGERIAEQFIRQAGHRHPAALALAVERADHIIREAWCAGFGACHLREGVGVGIAT
jgi:hypothetical protein